MGVKYDDASWHYGGDFPEELPESAGTTHMGMFVAWLLLHDMGSDIFSEEELAKLKNREITPGTFVSDHCDEKFVDEMLNQEGNAFAMAYYEAEGSRFAEDYEDTVVGSLPSIYHVDDSWANYDKLLPVFDARYTEWKGAQAPPEQKKPWWKLR